MLLIAYEDMTANDTGPGEATRIAHFLGQTEGVEPIVDESIPCVWDTVVNFGRGLPPPQVDEEEATGRRKLSLFKDGGSEKKQKGTHKHLSTHAPSETSLRSGPRVRPYSQMHLESMIAMFERLRERYGGDEEFVRIMNSYIEVVSNTPVEEGIGADWWDWGCKNC